MRTIGKNFFKDLSNALNLDENEDDLKKFMVEAPLRENAKLILYYKDETQKTIETKYPSDDFVKYVCGVADICDNDLFGFKLVCDFDDIVVLKLDFYMPRKIYDGVLDFLQK